jgi:hypothetical protein
MVFSERGKRIIKAFFEYEFPVNREGADISQTNGKVDGLVAVI